MTIQEKLGYADKRPVAILPMSNFGGLVILDVCHENGDDTVVAAYDFGNGYQNTGKYSIHYTVKGRSFFTKNDHRYYLDEFLRTE